jgi:hypothetical protein
MNPRIYSDYNGPYQPEFMLLHYVGTKADLDRLGITLTEGMSVTVYSDSAEDEDLEADGIVRYGIIPDTERDPCWYVDTRGSEVRYVKRPD